MIRRANLGIMSVKQALFVSRERPWVTNLRAVGHRTGGSCPWIARLTVTMRLSVCFQIIACARKDSCAKYLAMWPQRNAHPVQGVSRCLPYPMRRRFNGLSTGIVPVVIPMVDDQVA